jgi:hypothetical protein
MLRNQSRNRQLGSTPSSNGDPDTVRLGRSTDYDITGTWQVVAGPTDDPQPLRFTLGFRRPDGRRPRHPLQHRLRGFQWPGTPAAGIKTRIP